MSPNIMENHMNKKIYNELDYIGCHNIVSRMHFSRYGFPNKRGQGSGLLRSFILTFFFTDGSGYTCVCPRG